MKSISFPFSSPGGQSPGNTPQGMASAFSFTILYNNLCSHDHIPCSSGFSCIPLIMASGRRLGGDFCKNLRILNRDCEVPFAGEVAFQGLEISTWNVQRTPNTCSKIAFLFCIATLCEKVEQSPITLWMSRSDLGFSLPCLEAGWLFNHERKHFCVSQHSSVCILLGDAEYIATQMISRSPNWSTYSGRNFPSLGKE